MKLGNLKQGKEYLKECLGYANVRGSNILTGLAARHLAEAYLKENKYDLSLDFIRQSYDARKKIQNTIGMVDCAELLVRVYVRQAKYVQATELLAGTHVLRAQLGYPFVESQRIEILESRDELRSKMGETEFGRVWSEGAKKNVLHELESYLQISVIAIANISGALH
jgi:hypothetical protein